MKPLLIVLTFALSVSVAAAQTYERIIIPVPLGEQPGANGSLWDADAWLFNNSDATVWAPVNLHCQLSAEHACDMELAPGVVLSPGVEIGEPWQFWMPVTEGVSMSLHLREKSRNAEAWGTELPIATERDFRPTQIDIIAIPNDPSRRISLRVLALGEVPTSFTVRVYAHAQYGSGELIATLQMPGVIRSPLGESFTSGEIHNLLADVNVPANAQSVRLSVTATDPDAKLWGFVTSTNNETQHVTVFRPQ